MGELLHPDVTGPVIQAFYSVYNILGYGFIEGIYENALAIEARKAGLRMRQQVPVCIHYNGVLVGKYRADIVADDKVIVEVKAAQMLADRHEAQILNYLKATRFEVGLLVDFGPKPEFRRRVFENSRKGSFAWLNEKAADGRGVTPV